MFGVDGLQRGIAAVVEMKDFVIRLSRELNLPIVAETTSEQLLVLFARYGFQVYDKWDVPEQQLTMWFIIREPN